MTPTNSTSNTPRLADEPKPTPTPQASRRLRLWPLVIVAVLVGFFGAVSMLRGISTAYSYYFNILLGFWDTLPFHLDLFLGFILFAAAVGLLIYAVLRAESPVSPPPWRKIDFLVLALFVPHIVLLCVSLLRVSGLVNLLLPLSVIAYLVPMIVLAEGFARIRDKQLLNTCYWLRFFRAYPLNKAIALLMAVFLIIGVLVPFVAYSHVLDGLFVGSIPLGYYDSSALPVFLFGTEALFVVALVIFPLFAVCAMTYYCYHLLTLSDELAAKYEKANEEKIRAERFKSELITNVSHDIRTPLTSIINYVDLLEGLPIEDPHYREYIEVLERKSARLKSLTNDLLEASKASTGNMPITLCATDLAEIVGQIAGEFDDQFVEKNLTLVFSPAAEVVWVQADTKALWRILENLFGNAAKYSLPGTRVFAEISTTERTTKFSFKNTSQTPLDVGSEELVEQFIRGDRARSTDGNGLGLYIAKSLSDVMGVDFSIHTSGDLFEARICFTK